MNNKAKILIAVGVLGLALLLGGTVMGSGLSAIPAMFSDVTYPDGSQQMTDVKNDDIRAVELTLFNSDVKIKLGETFELTGSGLTDSYVSNGTFYAGATEAEHSASIFGSKINVPSKWVCGFGSYVLTIPEKNSLEQITIHTNQCDITGDNLVAANVAVEMKSGSMDINTIIADNLTLTTTRGKISVQNTQINGSATVEATKDIALGNHISIDNALNNLTLTTSRGDITLSGKATGSSVLKTKSGDINATLCGNTQNYSLSAAQGTLNTTPSTGESTDTTHYGDISFDCKRGTANASFQEVVPEKNNNSNKNNNNKSKTKNKK